MSDFYQQEVTKYMMRRAKRLAAQPSSGEAAAPAEDNKKGSRLLMRLRNLSPGDRTTVQIRSVLEQKSAKPVR